MPENTSTRTEPIPERLSVEAALRDICEWPKIGRVAGTGSNRVKTYTFTREQLNNARAALGLPPR